MTTRIAQYYADQILAHVRHAEKHMAFLAEKPQGRKDYHPRDWPVISRLDPKPMPMLGGIDPLAMLAGASVLRIRNWYQESPRNGRIVPAVGVTRRNMLRAGSWTAAAALAGVALRPITSRADTVNTISGLLTNEFQDGQAAGSITPVRIRDLIVTLQAMYGSVAVPEMYGATGNGVTDDTAAFNSALAAANVVIVGPKKYVVSSVLINSANILMGMFAPIMYDDNSSLVTGSAVRPQIIAKAAATDIFNVSTCSRYALLNMLLNGNGTNCNGCSDSSSSAAMGYGLHENLTIVNCNHGMGGARASGGTSTARVHHCEFGSCAFGVANLNDGQFDNCDFSSNTNNACYIGSGYGASYVNETRMEFNGTHGFVCDGATDVGFTGCWSDQNAGCAFLVQGSATNIAINGGVHRGNGTSNVAGKRSHVSLNTCTHVTVNGMATRVLNSLPLYFIEYAGTNSNVTLTGNDAEAQTADHIGTNPTTYRAVGNLGMTDV